MPGLPGITRSPAIAASEAEGYTTSAVDEPHQGYVYKLLNAQGSAPGGAKSYLSNGKLFGGFALIAYPTDESVDA
jgi:hypothetical protein